MDLALSEVLMQLGRLENWSESALGVSACHLPTLKEIEFESSREFDLCSTYKIPIAVCLLQKIENGELDLNTLVDITEYDLRPGVNSTLNQLQYTVPVKMSILNLLQFMMQESCNSSTDIILKLVGGAGAVRESLKKAGIDNLRVDRSILEYMAESSGVEPIPDRKCKIQELRDLQNKVSLEVKAKALEKQKQNLRDHGQAKSMTKLLVQIYQHKILSETYSTLLLKIMQRCKTGQQRIMGMLPPTTKVSHKTGTDTHYAHDAGIIYLPDGKGAIALSIFVETAKPQHIAERVIAEAARNIYDYYLFLE
ncbi:MAG: beta-lactamase [Gammaproteobacteria bacterium]|nr:beta-lactamase [Gammaproteobacteria bacterium]